MSNTNMTGLMDMLYFTIRKINVAYKATKLKHVIHIVVLCSTCSLTIM